MFFSKVQEQDQYHQTIRNLVVVVGSLFSNMVLVRKNHKTNEIEEKILVPINFANRDKMLTLVREAPSVPAKNTNYSLPRIGFSFDGLSYEGVRQLPKTGGRGRPTNEQKNKKNALTVHNAVPYNFEFSVSILTKYAEDLTQLVEKILPYFAPNLNVTYKAMPEIDLDIDVPIMLNGVTWNDQFEGLEERRILTADLSLTAKSYIFPPIKDYPKIHRVSVETQIVAGGPIDGDRTKLRQEVGVPFATETSGTMRTEKTSDGLTNPLNEASLVEIYGYDEKDDFGFESFVYEGSEYEEEREREEIWNQHEQKEEV